MMPPKPYMFGAHIFVNGIVHFMDRGLFSNEWVLICGERLQLDANWPERFGTDRQVDCLLCIEAEGGVSVANLRR